MGLFSSISAKLFGTRSQRELKAIQPLVDQIEGLGAQYHAMTDAQLRSQTDVLKGRLAAGETLDAILPDAFAAMREAADRVLGKRPYPVQLLGGIVLHQGRIAEMKTGEGKTLVAILPAYLNALTGKGVHIVTVNDYLAKYQGEMMGNVFRFMGLSCGIIVHGLNNDQRRAAYAADVTYGTNNEFGFDYLRDNMAIYKKEMVQRGHHFAIVDEVDSILIDEARTPLIISGQGEASTKFYEMADQLVRGMSRQVFTSTDEKEDQSGLKVDYIVDEKARTATLTAQGIAKAEKYFGLENLSDPENATIMHHINQALKAHGLFRRDTDYVVKDGEVIIVDEFTGRLMYGRRYSEGLHQAIEAKEGVTVARESKTLATITFQNFFRLYHKLSGMTGTALTEAEEFESIYNLDVIEIPTNRPVIRVDNPDAVYKTQAGKLRAVIRQIETCHAKGQPVLVGTVSVEKSEQLSAMLKKAGIPHTVLNAKHHEREAEIVAQAGKLGAVTIATNMAGRGTDIMLGGNADFLAKDDLRRGGMDEALLAECDSYAETDDADILAARAAYRQALAAHEPAVASEAEKVRAAGGLFIIGTERHESRRIDNQLRGRSGRQGDPGETRFYLSMEDDIMRLFGAERIKGMMETLGIDEDTPIDQKILTNAIESAQKRVESRNFQLRKNVLEYDDVMNTQRTVIYEQRRKVLDGEDLHESIVGMLEGVLRQAVAAHTAESGYFADEASVRAAIAPLEGLYFAPGAFTMSHEDLDRLSGEDVVARLKALALETYARKEEEFTAPVMRELERVILLRVVDEFWMDHIDAMHELRQGISLRAYGQNDPVIEYKREGYDMFEAMIAAIREETVRRLFTVRLRREDPDAALQRKKVATVTAEGATAKGAVKRQPVRKAVKVGRNDPCPCGSGKKYKHCCLGKEQAGQ